MPSVLEQTLDVNHSVQSINAVAVLSVLEQALDVNHSAGEQRLANQGVYLSRRLM